MLQSSVDTFKYGFPDSVLISPKEGRKSVNYLSGFLKHAK
jgi:hypothetical protein